MQTSSEMIRVALLALLSGALLPLLIQLFLTLRGLRRTTEALERRMDQTLRTVGDLAAAVKERAAAQPSLGAIAVAATPALVAAVRAFRLALHDRPADPHNDNSNHANHSSEEKIP